MIFQRVTQSVRRGKILLATAVLVLSAANLPAQTHSGIILSRREVSLSELFRQIERQTGSVVVTSNAIDDSRTITLPGTRLTTDEILDRIVYGTMYRYQMVHGFIIIDTKREEPSESRTQANIYEGDLWRLEPEPKIVFDSIVRRVENPNRGPFRFGADDKLFLTPGRPTTKATVTERRERSKFALKTNLLYGLGTLTPNLRAEFGLGNRTSLEVGVSYNWRNLHGTTENNKKYVHGVTMFEFRYWLCQRLYGHFFGIHPFGGFFNVGGYNIPLLFEKQFRYEGTMFGAGLSYGYMLPLSTRWGVEFNVGVGVAQLKYDKYGCDKCDEREGTYRKMYFGPTRAGINLVFIIK